MAMFTEDFDLFSQLKREERAEMMFKLQKKIDELTEDHQECRNALRWYDRKHKALLDAENKNVWFNRNLMANKIRRLGEELDDLIRLKYSK